MDETTFWGVIDTLDGKVSKKAREAFKDRLNGLPDDEVIAFGDELSAKIHALDTEAHFNQLVLLEPGDEPEDELDEDLFAELRIAVVIAGRKLYESVLGNPNEVASRYWETLDEGDKVIQSLDDVFARRGIGDGSYEPKYELGTESSKI